MILRNRRLNRWRKWDYSRGGWYFITVCTGGRKYYFGNVKEGKMILNDLGNLAEKLWLEIPKHFGSCRLDKFVVMPNHIHGILIIRDDKLGNALRDVGDDILGIKNS